VKLPALYFDWLQKDVPTGSVDRFPELTGRFETSVRGVYCIGDLTGIPLIKLAADSGCELMERLSKDERFKKDREANVNPDIYDLIIIGAGPAGISASMHALEMGYKHAVIESSQKFNTIVNFPTGKPIYVTPQDQPFKSSLTFSDGSKETLLEELYKDIEGKALPMREGEMVKQIIEAPDHFQVESSKGVYKALRVIVAIGKTGNARQLGAPGEKLPKVFTRLIDPGEFNDKEILVVGGGDSAIEAAVALAKNGNQVTMSYRKASLSRPKEHNIIAFQEQVEKKSITPLFESKVMQIGEKEVLLATKEGEKKIPNDAVFALIGTEIPIQFFRRSKIKMEGEKNAAYWINVIAMVSFFTMLYYGKSGFAINAFADKTGVLQMLSGYLTAPFTASYSWSLHGYAWYSSLNFLLGWIGSLVFIVTGLLALIPILRQPKRSLGTPWGRIKYSYLLLSALIFLWIYMSNVLGRAAGWVAEPTFWYSLLYTTTIILFGLRRIQVKPTRYIAYQTLTLMGIQTFFLFLLPFYLYDSLVVKAFGPQSWLIREVFPQGKWSSFGLILFWPLNINNFGTSTFWTWFPFIQTFGILLYIVQRWGKGVYCGWICSCGAMAETLGDEYRTLTPHGPKAKKMDNMGQVVLWFAFIATALHFSAMSLQTESLVADTLWGAYKLGIDVFFAGVLGLGVYFFMGGRVWCRFGCPLAALMHFYTRFSPYRIMSNKKRCISCNICTKVCHMGIDVMGYANKGIPMNDVECVRCSACIVNCPMQVLTFGDVGKVDPSNIVYKDKTIPLKKGWETGLYAKDIDMLLEEEKRKHYS